MHIMKDLTLRREIVTDVLKDLAPKSDLIPEFTNEYMCVPTTPDPGVKVGCTKDGFGNVVIIDHPNGTQTLYAHQSKLATVAGAEVFQGEVIGYVGTTGHSTGPHLHFEVHGAQNPGVDGSWKY